MYSYISRQQTGHQWVILVSDREIGKCIEVNIAIQCIHETNHLWLSIAVCRIHKRFRKTNKGVTIFAIHYLFAAYLAHVLGN